MISSQQAPKLSKSRFMAGLQCLKRLYLECYSKDLADPIDEQQQAIFDTGTHVGEIAREFFPQGRLIEEPYWELSQAIKATEVVMADNSIPAIYEGAFTFEKIRIRVDVLKRNEDGSFDLIEVKSTTSAKDVHIPDVAIQLYVLEGLGISIKKAYLMHLNNTYVYEGGPYKLDQLFSTEDVTEVSRRFLTNVAPDQLSKMWSALGHDESPNVDIGTHCTIPYRCPFYGHCHQTVTEHPISDLPRAGGKLLEDLHASGIQDIRSIPADYRGLNSIQRQIRECVVTDRPFIGPDLRRKLGDITYPVSFLDFETFSPALPAYIGTRPYQAVPFQWSLHIKSPTGELNHKSFLCDNEQDPRLPFIESLLKAIPLEGSVVTYSNYERTIIKQLAGTFPEFQDRLFNICDRTYDLLKLIREEYYHPQFHGSFSIKSVLPVLVPELGYEDLTIQDGFIAAADFGSMVFKNSNATQKNKTLNALLAYCQRDTEAMVRIFDVLCEMKDK